MAHNATIYFPRQSSNASCVSVTFWGRNLRIEEIRGLLADGLAISFEFRLK